ncbi:hypothetical protein HDV00_011225 [Rhizophlyctis rosea]|nr:hypothetical protein HDV00_011225 [Rhizophlyctis rosea]
MKRFLLQQSAHVESPYRKKVKYDGTVRDITFQAISWSSDDGQLVFPAKEDDDNPEVAPQYMNQPEQFTVRIYGKTAEGSSVAASVTGGNLSFSVQFDEALMTADHFVQVQSALSCMLVRWKVTDDGPEGQKEFTELNYGDHLLDEDGMESGKTLWGFTVGEQPFFTFRFTSKKAYYIALKLFKAASENTLNDRVLQKLYATYTPFQRRPYKKGDNRAERETHAYARRIWKSPIALFVNIV